MVPLDVTPRRLLHRVFSSFISACMVCASISFYDYDFHHYTRIAGNTYILAIFYIKIFNTGSVSISKHMLGRFGLVFR